MYILMMLLFALGPLDGMDDLWKITDMDIFYRLGTGTVVVKSDGSCFVLDRDECQILLFGADSKKIKAFGGKGKGPGEFQRPSSIFQLGDKLYVSELRKTSIFDLDGNFLKQVPSPTMGAKLRKVSNGWIVAIRNFPRPGQKAGNNSLLWRDDEMGNEQVLDQSPQVENFNFASKTFYFNFAEERTITTYSKDGNRVFVRPSGQAKVLIFDVPTAKVIRTIDIKDPKKPFSIEQGEKRFAEFQKSMKKRMGADFKMVKRFPDYYPAVTNMTWTSEGLLGVFQNTFQEPGHYDQTFFFDRDGQPASSKYGPYLDKFIVATQGEWAYVSVFDYEEEAASLVRHPLKGLKLLLVKLQEAHTEERKKEED